MSRETNSDFPHIAERAGRRARPFCWDHVPKGRKKNKKRIQALALSLLCAAALCACSPKAPASSAPSSEPESSSSEPESKPESAEEEKEEYPILEDITKDVALAEASDEAFRTQYPAEGWTFDNSILFAIYQDEDVSGGRVNVNAIVSEPCDGELPYGEISTTITDRLLDMAIAEGLITEEMAEQRGGREAMTSGHSSEQISIYAVSGGHVVAYTGNYYGADGKEGVLAVMETMIIL